MARIGTLYEPRDYLGFWKRSLISVVDLAVILVVGLMLTAIAGMFLDADEDADVLVGGTFVVTGVLYQVFLKRSSARTVGYRLFGAKIVSLTGDRPSIWQMIQRLGFLVIGPGNYILDLLWITEERTKQALRDRWAGTYVIRASARPRATGPIVTAMHNFFGFSMLFDEVREEIERTG